MKVNIAYNRFLDPIFVFYCEKNYPDWKKPSLDEVNERIKKYKLEWDKYEKKVNEILSEFLTLPDSIDVHIVSGNPRPFSNPIVLKSGYHPEEFVQTLIHELIHRIFTLNKIKNNFIHENDLTKNHIPVFALMSYIFSKIKPEWTEQSIERSNKSSFEGYKLAWEYIKDKNVLEIIKNIK